jgi:hypothetical protein
MDYLFFNRTAIESLYINKNTLDTENLLIASVSDHLMATEQLKTSGCTMATIESMFTQIINSNIIWAELNVEIFCENAFVNDPTDLKLKTEIEQSDTCPSKTCNIIAILSNEKSCFWDTKVYDEMLEFYE